MSDSKTERGVAGLGIAQNKGLALGDIGIVGTTKSLCLALLVGVGADER